MFTKEDNEVLDRILKARKTCRAFSGEMPTDDEIKDVWRLMHLLIPKR